VGPGRVDKLKAAKRIVALFEKDRQKIQGLGRVADSALRVHHALRQSPVAGINKISGMTGLTIPAVTLALKGLQEQGIVRELTGRKRGRLFAYNEYIRILSEGTEPIRRS
jgi:Fic family protein